MMVGSMSGERPGMFGTSIAAEVAEMPAVAPVSPSPTNRLRISRATAAARKVRRGCRKRSDPKFFSFAAR